MRISLLLPLLSLLSLQPTLSRFDPYAANGGLTCGIAGKDYVVLMTTKELLLDSNTVTNNHDESRLTSLSPTASLLSAGCNADCVGLVSDLKAILYKDFSYPSSSPPPTPSQISTLLSHLLYSRRSFPFYVQVILGGICPTTGSGQLWGYDSIGSCELGGVFCSGGAASGMLQSILDARFASKASSLGVSRLRPLDQHKVGNSLSPPVHTTIAVEDPEESIDMCLSAFREVCGRHNLGGIGKKIKIVVHRKDSEATTRELVL